VASGIWIYLAFQIWPVPARKNRNTKTWLKTKKALRSAIAVMSLTFALSPSTSFAIPLQFFVALLLTTTEQLSRRHFPADADC